jgi:prepilin-type N-terminal cleavage/methylation domain-containing protein/prepilin-type processing-associated H-X9-DG protein
MLISKPTTCRRAFTLIELLVVIAIIGLLLAVIIPALRTAKTIAAAAVCLANESQMIKAWLQYAGDYDSNIADGDTGDVVSDPGYNNFPPRVWCWVGRPMGPQRQDVNKTVEDEVRGLQAGALWSYLEAQDVYNCPIDKRYLKPATYKGNSANNYDPDWKGGYRSYSIGKVLSKRSASGTGEDDHTVSKISEFTVPGSKIVFLEESDGYGWNHRTWNMNLNTPKWVDPFAIWHNGSSTLAFADGHAERHKWVSKNTLEMAEAQQKDWPATNPNGTASEDYLWFKRAYIPGK